MTIAKTTVVLIATFIGCHVASVEARAEENAAWKARRWNAQLFTSAMTDPHRDVEMYGASAGIGYAIWENFSLNAEFSGLHVDQDTGNATAGGVTLGFRHHLLNIGDDARLFADVGGGFMKADNPLPPGGTTSNTTFHTGLGLEYPLENNLSLIGGARYFHLSNGDRESNERNPAVNAVQGFVGVMVRF